MAVRSNYVPDVKPESLLEKRLKMAKKSKKTALFYWFLVNSFFFCIPFVFIFAVCFAYNLANYIFTLL